MAGLPLKGRRIALLETRMAPDFARLVERLGGTPVGAPSVREVPRVDDVDRFVGGVTGGAFGLAVFQTGVGVTALFREAERRGRLDDVIGSLRKTTVACRGPKPLAGVPRARVTPALPHAQPHTEDEPVEA